MNDISYLQDLKELNRIKEKLAIESPTIIDEQLLKKINNSPLQIENRLKGLEKEDEFGLYLLTTNIEQMVILKHQKQFINKEKYLIPDFLVAFKIKENLQRMFIEVKTIKSKEFTISGFDYNRLKSFCNLYTLPLYFAIYIDDPVINQFSLIPGKLLIDKAIKKEIKHNNRIQDCYVISWNELLKFDCSGMWLNNLMLVLQKGTSIFHIYDNAISNKDTYNPKFGELIEMKINFANIEKVISMDGSIDARFYHLILNQLCTKFANKTETIKENITTVTYSYDTNVIFPYNTFVLNSYIYFKNLRKEEEYSHTYLLNNFTEVDYNLILYFKYFIKNLINEKFIFAFKNLPSTDT
jgi:hypothetical protein